MSPTPAERYSELLADGILAHDPAQARLAERLSSLSSELETWLRRRQRSALSRLLGRGSSLAPRGLYIHGDVGRGKTMMVDLFFDAAPIAAKRRAHFNDFMADIHERIHAVRARIGRKEIDDADPIPRVASEVASRARLICLDEFHIDDITDAMIIGRLFGNLFAQGVVAVTTSNAAPDELYAGGLKRELFLPFIALLKKHMDVIRLDAETDYRLDKLRAGATWFTPIDTLAEEGMNAAWRRFAGSDQATPNTVQVKGREIPVPRTHMGVARFDFADLCKAPLGPNDFLALARAFHTILIDRIPVIAPRQRNEARRFVLLIDTLYDHKVKLVASAAAEPDGLYPEGPLSGEFRRTASRLVEMRSDAYLAEPHGSKSSSGTETAAHATQSTAVP